MLQPNASIIAEKLNNYKLTNNYKKLTSEDNEKSTVDKHNLRTLLRTVEHCIKPFVASSDIARIRKLNYCIASYMMRDLKLSRYDIIATCKALNQESYNQLVSKAIQDYDSKDDGFNETKLTSSHIIKLISVERDKLKTPTTLGHSFNAMQYGTVDKTTKVKSEKPVSVNCKVVSETNTDDGNTAIQFSFMTNEFIKADNRMGIKNLDGKPVKSLVEIWHYARVYKFSKSFELTVTNYTDSLFPTDGYLVDYPDYRTRADVAMLFESLISNGSFEFVKTLEHEGKVVITSCYDPSIFLLLELLEHCQIEEHISDKYKFKPIEFNTVMQCMINAADKATKSGIPLIDGMLLHSLFTAAKEQLKTSKNETFLNDKQIDNHDKIELAKMIKAKKREMADRKHGRII